MPPRHPTSLSYYRSLGFAAQDAVMMGGLPGLVTLLAWDFFVGVDGRWAAAFVVYGVVAGGWFLRRRRVLRRSRSSAKDASDRA